MRRSVFSVGFLILVGIVPVLVCAGCSGDGTLAVSWNIVDQNGATVACQAGEQVRVSGDGVTDTLACSLGSATLTGFAAGTFQLTFELLNSAGNQQVETSQNVTFTTGHTTSISETFSVTTTVATASLVMTWGISDGSGDYVACQPGETVSITLNSATPVSVLCGPGQYSFSSLPVGTTNVSAILLDANGAQVAAINTIDLSLSATAATVQPVIFQVAAPTPQTGYGSVTFTWTTTAPCTTTEVVTFSIPNQDNVQVLCSNGMATIDSLPDGTFDVSATLTNGTTAEDPETVQVDVEDQTNTVAASIAFANSR